MEEIKNRTIHTIVMHDRSELELTGVNDVLSFDVNEVSLDTQAGALIINGKDLHVKHLNLERGELDLEGTVDSIVYSKTAIKKESFFSRMLK